MFCLLPLYPQVVPARESHPGVSTFPGTLISYSESPGLLPRSAISTADGHSLIKVLNAFCYGGLALYWSFIVNVKGFSYENPKFFCISFSCFPIAFLFYY